MSALSIACLLSFDGARDCCARDALVGAGGAGHAGPGWGVAAIFQKRCDKDAAACPRQCDNGGAVCWLWCDTGCVNCWLVGSEGVDCVDLRAGR